MKISRRALKHLTPTEIRDLTEVFQTFDKNENGYLKPLELFLALKALGFSVNQKNCEDYVETVTEMSEIKFVIITFLFFFYKIVY
jgi:Ca2+-binding EF-hand superfamily protein